MKEVVIPPPRRLALRIVDRIAEVTLVVSIAILAVLALRLGV
ncbi:hypothetical protein [Shinella zoogloeoides]|nr:hypothetical protein [Shinella zoogloeoides]